MLYTEKRQLSRQFLRLLFEQFVYFSHEFGNVFKFEIDGGKTQVGYLVEPPKFREQRTADNSRFEFALRAFLHALFHLVHDFLQLRKTYRPLFARLQETAKDLIAIEPLA